MDTVTVTAVPTPTTVRSVGSASTTAPLNNSKAYMLADATKGRNFFHHGFTTKSLWQKRYNENTSAAALTLNLMLPFLNGFNTRLESHIKDGVDLSANDAMTHLTDCAVDASVAFLDVIARVAIQAGIATYLIDHPTASGNATVYLWDAYPRLHRKYLGEVVTGLRLPKFIATLFGVMPSEKDIQIFDTKVAFSNAFEDSFRRHLLTTIADVIVTSARHAITTSYRKQKAYKLIAEQRIEEIESGLLTVPEADALSNQKRREVDAQHAVVVPVFAMSVQKTAVLIGRAFCGAIGNVTYGGRGEYWGEMIGGIIIASQTAVMLSKFVKKQTPTITAAKEDGSE